MASCVALGLIATACGSTDAEPAVALSDAPAVADGQVVSLTIDGEVRSMIDGLAVLHPESAGSVALVNALERGYDYLQVRDAITNQSLMVDGRISDAAGEVVPSGRRVNIVLLPGDPGADEGALAPACYLARFQDAAQLPEDLVANMSSLDVQLRDVDPGSAANAEVTKGQVITAAIISLARSGYTLDQIIEVLVFQTARIGVNDSNCAVILGVNNVRPKGSLNNLCSRSVHQMMDDLDEVDARQDAVATDSAAESAVAPPVAEPATVGSVVFVGTVTQGSRDSPCCRDNLITVTFEALVEGDTVVIVADYSEHIWLKGGPTDPPFEDQNCGATQKLQLRGEGPAGSPTTINLLIVSSELVDQHGEQCFSRAAGESEERPLDTSSWTPDPGSPGGRFQGQANGLGVDGTLKNVPIQANVPN